MSAPKNGARDQCMCEADITYVVLPSDLARISGEPGFWKHVETNDRYCYLTAEGLPEDHLLMAQPA